MYIPFWRSYKRAKRYLFDDLIALDYHSLSLVGSAKLPDNKALIV